MDHITELFCVLDDVCKEFNQSLKKALISNNKTKPKKSALSLSEAMTIVIYFINLVLASSNILLPNGCSFLESCFP